MGAGKSTFARVLMSQLGIPGLPAGSPTFAIAHEYRSDRGDLIHLDLYRIKSEIEIEEAGIHSYFWERECMVIAEWTSLFPEFRQALFQSLKVGSRIFDVHLEFDPESDLKRKVSVHAALGG